MSQGLSNGRVFDIEQDSLGYMWLATANGLTRYSGTTFKKYLLKPDGKSTDPSVLKLLKHRDRLFALMPRRGIFVYNHPYDRWEKVFEVPGRVPTAFTTFGDDKLIVGTVNGFFIYDLQQQTLSERLFADFTFIRRVENHMGKLYVSTSKGVHILTVDTSGQLSEERVLLEGIDILDFEIDSNHVVWIGTENKGLYHFHHGELNAVPFIGETPTSVRDIAVNQDGNILLAVDRLGFFMLDHFGKLITKVAYDPDDTNSLSQNSINTIYVDNRNITWLGIGEIGLNILYQENAVFQNIRHQRYAANTINNDIIRSIFQDNKGQVWFGTEDGVSRLGNNRMWYNFGEASGIGQTPVLAIEGYRGGLVLGTYGEGLLQYDPNQDDIRPFRSKLSLKRIFALLTDHEYLWVGGLDGPVHKMLGDTIVATFSTGQVKTFEKKDHRTLLVGTVEGIYQIDVKDSTVRKLQLGDTPINNVYSLKYDHQNKVLWIGNDYGLWKYDDASNLVESVEVLNSSAGAVYSILQTTPNQIWLATEKGLFRYFTDKGTFRKYAENDGQLIAEFGFGAKAVLMDKRLAFGGPNGAVLFDAQEVKADNALPKIFISGFEINGAVPTDENQPNLNFRKYIELEYDRNTLKFDIDYLKLHGSKDYTLEWQLEGRDEKVRVANNQNTIAYSNLKPGNYLLTASVVNADGLRSPNVIDLNIKIKHPLWLRWWAVMAYLAIAALMVYALAAINKALQERKFSENKIRFFIDVAHDIRTPVSLIRLASDQLLQKNDIEESVNIIKRYASNLNEYVTELLDFQKAEHNKLRIMASEFDLTELIGALVKNFKPMTEQKRLNVEVNMPKTLPIWGDKAQLERVFTNLMSNSIKYNHENGNIRVTVTASDSKVQIKFEDTGLGIPKNQLDKIFTRFHRAENVMNQDVRGTGIGLMLSKRIVELHKGKILCESVENKGSTFLVELLGGKEHFSPSELRITATSERISRITEASVKGKSSILIVEDNEDLLAFIKNSLSDEYYIITATNGKEGLYQVFEQQPDLVISDVMLPGMNGKELCHIVKNDKKVGNTPVVLMTALGGVDDKIAGLEVGADYYIEKPFNIDVLKLAVKNILKKSQLDKEIKDKTMGQATHSPEESLLSNFTEIIHNNLNNPTFTMDQLCDELGLSRSNLFRKIKGITGLSPSELAQEIKLNKAQQLLKNDPNIRIDDVAFQAGFNDPKYFSTIFKKHFHKTPREFQAFHHK